MHAKNGLHATLLGIVISLLMLAWSPAYALPDPKGDPEVVFTWADEALDDIYAAVGKTSVDRVFAILDAAIAAHPESAKLYLMKWRAYVVGNCIGGDQRCGSGDASLLLRKAVELDPRNSRIRAALVIDAVNHNCMQCIGTHLAEALKLGPRDPYVLDANARVEEMSGNGESAIALFLQSIDGFPTPQKKYARYVALSQLYKKDDNMERTGWALERALEARPDSSWALGNLANHYLCSRGEFARAIPLYRRALGKMSYGQAEHGLSVALWEQWGDAYLSRAAASQQKAFLDAAEAAEPDKEAAFLASTLYVGTGRAARALLEAKRVPKGVLEATNSDGLKPLLSAANNDNRPLALYLVQAGADVNARNRRGNSVVYVAAVRGNRSLFDALAARGADFRAPNPNGTVLTAAAKGDDFAEDRVAIARFLVGKGVDVEAVGPDGWTALTHAALQGSPEMVRFLLANGAKAGHANKDGTTPAEVAKMNFRPEIAEMLRAAEGH